MRRKDFLKLTLLPLLGFKFKRKMTHDEYCQKVCKAKCCRFVQIEGETRENCCPKLTSDYKCSIYNQWQNGSCGQIDLVKIGQYDVHTAPIEYALEHKLLPKWIEDECCYAHPELLEI